MSCETLEAEASKTVVIEEAPEHARAFQMHQSSTLIPDDLSSDDLVLAIQAGGILPRGCGPAEQHLCAAIGDVVGAIVTLMDTARVGICLSQARRSLVQHLLVRPSVSDKGFHIVARLITTWRARG